MKKFTSFAAIIILLLSIFSPVVEASSIYGPVQFERTEGIPEEYNDTFSLNSAPGNFTLYVLNGNGTTATRTSSALVTLNGKLAVAPDDFNQNVKLIQKNVSLQRANAIGVEMRSKPGSLITVWAEDEAPVITVHSPWDDTVSNEPVTVSGSVDKIIASTITLTHNDSSSIVPVIDGNFSTRVNLTGINNITLAGTDIAGRTRTVTILLDGDYLPASYELQLGFDPQNPDSDSSLTPENEAGNGILDGYEMLGGSLPAFAKSRIGADPFKEDTDDDGLTDYFELMKLGLITDVRMADSDSDGIPDPDEDIDSDNLTNIQEQAAGTDPLVDDTDGDTLLDGFEVNLGLNPLSKDTDSDRLSDDSELRLGTDPRNPDTDGDGIPDGDETYTSTKQDSNLGASASITGTGDLAKDLKIYNVTSTGFTENPALVSPVIDFSLNGTFESATVTLPIDASRADDASNISLFYFNESLGTFIQIPSTVDITNDTVSGVTSHFSTFAIFNVPNWNALFEAEMNTGRGGGVDVVYVDVLFTLDSSGSMSWNDPYGYRKIAAKNFVGSLLPGNRAGVVDFDYYAYLTRPL
ncbi:MAG TPA: VWA domain-containing protein, partial [Candidatus Methanoperedenaceae archaeon]|nr:VWA domain-containing protein [Candidatus Methanoperedenaceae archaeon]